MFYWQEIRRSRLVEFGNRRCRYFIILQINPGHRISYKIACVSSDDSDQPAHPRSLIRVFAVRMRTLCILGNEDWSDCAFAIRLRGYKTFSCSAQLSMKFFVLINLKLLTMPNYFLLNIAEPENFSANKYENAN